MPTKEEIRQALRQVLDPEIGRPLQDIDVEAGTVRVHVLITIEGCPLKDRINSDVTKALSTVPGVERVEVELSPMSEEQRAELVAKLRGPGAAAPQQQPTFFADGK